MNSVLIFHKEVQRCEWMSITNGRFLYAAQTHLSHDTEIRTALRASVLAHYVLSLARGSDNSCELFELENALNPGSASGCTKPAGRAARPAHTCLDLNPGSPDSRCLFVVAALSLQSATISAFLRLSPGGHSVFPALQLDHPLRPGVKIAVLSP